MTTTNFDYRNHDATVAWRIDERRQAIEEELDRPAARIHGQVFRRRFARIGAACSGLLGATTLAATLIVGAATRMEHGLTTKVFVLSLLAIPSLYMVAWVIAPWVERRLVRKVYAAKGDPAAALEVLRHATAASVTADVARRWERDSISLPLIAAALLGPLTLHAPFFATESDFAGEFGAWIAFSAVIVGHAHVAFAWLSHRFVVKLAEGRPLSPHPAVRAWGWTVVVAATPGVLLMGLPPILTAVTGAVLVGPMFFWARRTLERESRLLT